jgi:hypothetical protein
MRRSGIANLALLLLFGSAPPPGREVPKGDGFIYPGDPGSEGTLAYDRAYNAHMAALPPPEKGRPAALDQLAWMVGCWEVLQRDYAYKPPARATIMELGRGTADIGFTRDNRWLRVETDISGRSAFRFIGYDRASGKLEMDMVTRPGWTSLAPFRSSGWHGDRLVFGPGTRDAAGLLLTDRITFVRTGNDAFRIVVEGRLADGRFVAMDDQLFARTGDGACRRPAG